MKFQMILAAAIFLILASCASLSTEGEKVRTTNHGESVKGCKFIDQIEESTNLSGTGAIKAKEDLRIRLRNRAAEVGGDVVLLQDLDQSYTGFKMTGDVYKCPNK